MKMLLVLLVLSAVLLLPSPTRAQGPDKIAEIDEIFAFVTPNAAGCAVAVAPQGKLVVNRAYGLADLERDVPLSTNSLFDAGSVRKQFIAARAGDRRSFPRGARRVGVQIGRRVRIELPVEGPVRAEVHGRRHDTISPRPALCANRG